MPFTSATGFNEAVILGLETSFKTPPGTLIGFKLPVMNPTFTPKVGWYTSEALVGTPEPTAVVTGEIGFDGSFDLECNPLSMGMPLKGVFGTPDNQGIAGNYDHLYYLQGTRPSFYIEEQHSDVAQFFEYIGCRLGKASFKIDSEGIMKATFTLMGAGNATGSPFTSAQTTVPNTTDTTAALPLSYVPGTITRNGTTLGYVQSFSLDIDRSQEEVKCLDGTPTLADIISKKSVVTGKLDFIFSDTVLYADAINSANVNVTLYLPVTTGTPAVPNGQGIKIILPAVKIKPFGTKVNGVGGLVTCSADLSAQGVVGTSDLPGFAATSGFTSVTISTGTNDTVNFFVDGGSSLPVVFTNGAKTPAQIAAAILAVVTATATCVVDPLGRVVITSKTNGPTSSIKTTGNGCTLLGLNTGVVQSGYAGKSVMMILTNTIASY